MSWIARRDLYGVRNRKDRPQPPTGEERQWESWHAAGQENYKAGPTIGAERGPSDQPRGITEEARHGGQAVFHKDSLEAKTPAQSLTMGHLKHRSGEGKKPLSET